MQPRSPEEEHRVATPLELLFDLVFVVAVASASSQLHHGLAEAHVADSLRGYAMAFFGIWWAWMNFTWFASAYDTDDVAYRLAVFVQISGALVFAAGVSSAFNGDLLLAVVGYVLMRLALVPQWLRAARSDTGRRTSCLRYATGISVLQIAWIGLLFVSPEVLPWAFLALAVCEMLVPVWAERASSTPWHPEHISERYGLFTIIVLGESVLSGSLAIESATTAGLFTADMMTTAVGGLVIVLAMWWLYFERPFQWKLDSQASAFAWGYAHLLVWAAAAGVGAGLAVAIDEAIGDTAIGPTGAGLAVAVPVAIYLACLWGLHLPLARTTADRYLAPIAVVLILLTPLTGEAPLLTGLLLVGLLLVKASVNRRVSSR
jgi:low temperature requirement protein LtrA